MKKVGLILGLLLLSIGAFAQAPQVAISEPFEEPEGLMTKVIQTTNGNTTLIVFTKSDGLNTIVFDKNHKIIAHENIKGDEWNSDDMRGTLLYGIFEAGGSINVFIEPNISKPTLYRIPIDPVTGKGGPAQEMAVLPKSSASRSMVSGRLYHNLFYVVKDAQSDCYAVASWNSREIDEAGRLILTHYNAAGKEINHMNYQSENTGDPFSDFVGMTVNGEQSVTLCTVDFGTFARGGKGSRIVMSRLTPGNQQIQHKTLKIYGDGKKVAGFLFRSPDGRQGTIYYTILEDSKQNRLTATTTNYYQAMLMSVDLDGMKMVYERQMNPGVLNAVDRNRAAARKSSSDDVEAVIVHPDKSTSVLLYHKSEETSEPAIINYDSAGKERYVQLLPGVHGGARNDAQFDPMHPIDEIYKIETVPGFLTYDLTGFHQFDCIPVDNANMLFVYNERPETDPNQERRRRRTPPGSWSLFYTRLTAGTPEKGEVFDKPKDEDEHRFGYILSGQYDPASRCYAVLTIHTKGDEGNAEIAWIHFP